MLTEEAKRRLSQRYGIDAAAGPQKKELNVTGRGAGRMRAMQKNEKPQDTKESLRALLSFLAHEKGLVAAALFCAVAHTVTSLTASYLLRPVMNRFLYHDPAETDLTPRLLSLRTALLFMCVLYLVSVVTQYLQSRIMLSVSQRSLRRMRDTLYEKLRHRIEREFRRLGNKHIAGSHEKVCRIYCFKDILVAEKMDSFNITVYCATAEFPCFFPVIEVCFRDVFDSRNHLLQVFPDVLIVSDIYI